MSKKNLYRPSKVILKHLNYGNIAWGKHNIRLYNLQKNHSYLLLMINIMNISILKSLYLLNKVKDIQRLNVLNFIINITIISFPFFQRFVFKTRADMYYHDTRQKIEYTSV